MKNSTAVYDMLLERQVRSDLEDQQRRTDHEQRLQAAADHILETSGFSRQDRGSYVSYALTTTDSCRAAILQRNRRTGQVSVCWNETTHADSELIRALETSRHSGRGRVA